MKLIKKALFKNLIFLISLFIKPRANTWAVSISSGGGSRFAENCISFAEFLKSKKVKLYVISNIKLNKFNSEHTTPFSIKYIKALIYSKNLVVENDLHNDMPAYRSLGTFKINLFHGLALKKIYYSSKFIKKLFKKNIINYLRKFIVGFCFPQEYDLITTSNKLHKKKYIQAFENKNVEIFFQPRNCNLIKYNHNLSLKLKIKKKYQIKEKKKIITYLPTFRDTDPFQKECILSSNKNFQNFLIKNKLLFIYKNHHFYKNNNIKENKINESKKNIYNFTDSEILTQELLLITDLLITDYSGVYFDFLLLEKPIIFY